MNQEIVTIDLGSNSFRVLKYDCKNHKIISEYNEVVGMADGLVDTGIISKEAMQRVINAISHSSEIVKYNPRDAICVTTAAMRKASNNQEVLKYFKETSGADFSIIDGNEEARLTLLAVKYALKREKINSDKFILLDIGGGSTEIIINTNDNYEAHSFDFGIVTMTQKYLVQHDLHNDLDNRKKEIKKFLDSLNIDDLSQYSFVATAGTPTTIAAIKLGQDFFSYDRDIVNGTIVNLEDIENSLDIFKNSSVEEIGKNESIVLDDGLREGVAINYCETKCKD